MSGGIELGLLAAVAGVVVYALGAPMLIAVVVACGIFALVGRLAGRRSADPVGCEAHEGEVPMTGENPDTSGAGVACPCCGRRTLDARSRYDICSVCWWEDDGQDNEDADSALGGPNSDLSLTQARVNVILHGISNPRRVDLVARREPPESFIRDREFAITPDGSVVLEVGTTWRSQAFTAEVVFRRVVEIESRLFLRS